MCGIVGFVDPEGLTADPEAVLGRMSAAVAARGPDDHGEVQVGPLWAGHRRLAIVATGPEGRQPFVERDEAGAVSLVAWANGEIYNHRQLRTDLPGPEPGPSDCAVLPGLWRRYRGEMMSHLEGMFAFALWEASSGTLLLARDRAGQKPLFYAHLAGGGLAFASEPRALLLHPGVDRGVDGLSLRRYLAFDYTFGERTIHQGIRRLMPGHRLLWREGRVEVSPWWRIPDHPPEPIDSPEAGRRLWEVLEAAVSDRLMADVPLGVFLSGGVDSTALVAALASQGLAGDALTFSIGFREPSFDESGVARQVAGHFGTRHREQILEPEDLLKEIPAIIASMDQPLADPSIVPTTLLSRFARQEVTVALGGDGGDELLLGYPTFQAERVARWASQIPRAVRAGVVEPMARMLPVSSRYMSLDFKVKRFLSGLEHPPHRRHLIWIGGLPPSRHHEALAPRFRPDPDGHTDFDGLFDGADQLWGDLAQRRPETDEVSRLGWQYFQTYLPEDVLTKVDRASMSVGLEVRAPFLDSRVVDLCARLPPALQLSGGGAKQVLRRHLAALGVPPEVTRRPKQGFAMPVARWLRGPLAPWAREVLQPEEVARGGLLDPAWTTATLDAHVAGRDNHAKALWSALVLELWRRGDHGPGDMEGTG